MPPKQPKLTKKQIEEQKKEQARLQKIKEEEEAAAERARLEEQEKIREQQRQKQLQLERVRIAEEKQKQFSMIQEKLMREEESKKKFVENKNWEAFTTQYYKDYDIEGTKLSTFAKMFEAFEHKHSEATLQECQESEVYLKNLQEKLLECRAEYKEKEEVFYQKFIEKLHGEQIRKLQAIMIEYANGAEEMEEKNVEEAKKKNQQSGAQKIIKPVDNCHSFTNNFKIGMYINTLSTKNYNKFNPIGIKEFGFNSQVPSKWINNTSIVKFEWVNFDPFGYNKKEEFRIIGGVFNIQFYDMFIGSKKTYNTTVKRFYKGKQILERFKLPTAVIKEPFKLTYEIPQYVFLTPYTKQTLKIAQFDVAAGHWSILPNQSIFQYLEGEKKVTCRVSRPEPLAFVENKCIDYPYIAWELRTVDQGRVLLDIELQRFANPLNEEDGRLIVQFDIGPNSVKLCLNEKYPQFADLCENFHTPERMLRELSKRGIHLLPENDEYEYANLKRKDRESEKCAIRDLAYAIESFTVRSEPNPSDSIQVKIRENLDHENVFLEDQEKDWMRILWADEGKCSVTNRQVIERHLNLLTVLSEHELCESECIDRIKYDKNYMLRTTVMKMLELTRLLAFTTNDEEIKSNLVQILKKRIIVD